MDDLLSDFLTEASEMLAHLDNAMVKLEISPNDQATLAEAFRHIHTIKGTCGFLGLSRLEKVAHATENVLGKYRDGALKVQADSVTLILQALDKIKEIVSTIEATENEPAGDDAVLIEALNRAVSGDLSGLASVKGGEAEPTATAVPEAMKATEQHKIPDAAKSVDAAAVETPKPEAASAARAEATAVEGASEASGGVTQTTIRVSVEVLEDLMTLVSELVLTRNQLMQMARNEGNGSFSVPLQRLSHITSDLQEGVMKTRMQPIGNAWNKLPRLVRDLAHELKKKIELEQLGAETELDRQVLELIKDPLTHMVRNSADHGLETPEERRSAGKSDTGLITLNAFHEGGHIIIEISDDGRGLAIEKIKSKVLKQGLATEAELASMSDRDIQNFIFRAGFSTAAAITSVSGRGVGMDVVKTNIERIGGTIELRSTEGKGTIFTIKIPLTLAIVSALIVEASGERFAVPQIGVVELVRVGGNGGAQIEYIKDSPVMRLRDRLLPLVSLSGILKLDDKTLAAESAFVVVTQVGNNVFGIIVDKVFDTEEIVVKPVAPILRNVTMFSGNTILGDGSVIMILDPNGIARKAGVSTGAVESAGQRGSSSGSGGGSALRSDQCSALLLFRAGDETPKAVPLGLVARLEDIPIEKIELSGGSPVTQYRGRLMPLVPVTGHWMPGGEPGSRQAVLVFNDRDRAMGLIVEEILDVVEDRLDIELSGERPGFMGTAVIAGRATDVIDTGYWLQQAFRDWFGGISATKAGDKKQLLMVEDSAFFRHLIVPSLSAAGYEVTAVEDPTQALKLREAGKMFDAIISDIEMPGMDGLTFAHEVRTSGMWKDTPLIALTSKHEPADVERGRDAGFTDYVAKYDRETILVSLNQCLSHRSLVG